MKITNVLAACAALTASPLLAQAMSGPEYVMTAGASDLYERTSSQVVLETTTNAAVREFATMMIAHHTKSTADIIAAARRGRVAFAPPKLMPVQAELVAQLRGEQATARDAAYIAQQKASHGQALTVQKAYAEGGTVAPLREAATAIVPVVEAHLAMLMKM